MFRNTIESFDHQFAKSELTDSIDLGLRTVEVKKIVGSVNRWQDFDSHFRFKLTSRAAMERYARIKRALERGEYLPPVELYKIRNKYYVVDGNHRVAAAKEIGQTYIDAYITEYLPPGNTPEHLLWRERAQFEYRTGLSSIELTELGLYQKLFDQIKQFEDEEYEQHHLTDSFFHVARQWYDEIYMPVVQQIRKEKLLDDFPHRTEADLFLYATYHKMAKSRLTKEAVSYRQALADFRPGSPKTLKDRIKDTISSLLRLNDNSQDCPYGLILDEDGLVKITKNCGGCTKCHLNIPVNSHSEQPQIITNEDIKPKPFK